MGKTISIKVLFGIYLLLMAGKVDLPLYFQTSVIT